MLTGALLERALLEIPGGQALGARLITSTAILQSPVNCVLAGQQPYESSYRTLEGRNTGKLKYTPRMKRGSFKDLFKGD